MQKQEEIASLRTRWQHLDIASKDAFFKDMEDRSEFNWDDILEDLVPVVDGSQVRNFPF
jgi:hypothetical protein